LQLTGAIHYSRGMSDRPTLYEIQLAHQTECNRLERASDFWNHMAYGSAGSAAALLAFSQSPGAKLGAVLLAGTAAVCYGLHVLRDGQQQRAALAPLDTLAMPAPQNVQSEIEAPVPALTLQEQFDQLSAKKDKTFNSAAKAFLWCVGTSAFSFCYELADLKFPAPIDLSVTFITLAASMAGTYRGAQHVWALQKIENFKRATGFDPDAPAQPKPQSASPA
jgi:hypothetical protein